MEKSNCEFDATPLMCLDRLARQGETGIHHEKHQVIFKIYKDNVLTAIWLF